MFLVFGHRFLELGSGLHDFVDKLLARPRILAAVFRQTVGGGISLNIFQVGVSQNILFVDCVV